MTLPSMLYRFYSYVHVRGGRSLTLCGTADVKRECVRFGLGPRRFLGWLKGERDLPSASLPTGPITNRKITASTDIPSFSSLV